MTYMGMLRRDLTKLEHEEKETQKKISKLIIYVKNVFHFDWLRKVQLFFF